MARYSAIGSFPLMFICFAKYSGTFAGRLLTAGSVLLALPVLNVRAQAVAPQCMKGVTVQGKVLSQGRRPVGDAVVRLEGGDMVAPVETNSDATGEFSFPSIFKGSYRLVVSKPEVFGLTADVRPVASCIQTFDLILPSSGSADVSDRTSSEAPDAMQFSDEPNFTIAAVTDWTAIGGHGSDSTLRMSESLADASASLRPEGACKTVGEKSVDVKSEKRGEGALRRALLRDPGSSDANRQLGEFYLAHGSAAKGLPLLEKAYKISPTDEENEDALGLAYAKSSNTLRASERVHALLEHRQSAPLYELAGELDEKAGKTLTAAREFQEATKLQPSEQNYFELGSDLLEHRAVWQALNVFRAGVSLFPQSARMQTAMATALFSGARYEEASALLCKVSDSNPSDPAPYVFMGKIQIAAPNELACIEPRLARFAQQNPASPVASYLYAMAILKREQQSRSREDVEQAHKLLVNAIASDSHYGDAYLQLGIIAASQSKYKLAIGYYEKAIKVDPEIADTYYRLGIAYDRTSQREKAKREFKLHDRIKQQQQQNTEQQRLKVKQFVFAGSSEFRN